MINGKVVLATQAQRVALSALDPEDVLKLAKEWSMRREFKRRDLPDTPRDLNVDHLETIARLAGFTLANGAGLMVYTSSDMYPPPWMSDAAVTDAWVADPKKVTFGTGNGVASLAPEKGTIALAQAGGASLEPQLALTGWGKSNAPCITFDGTAQYFTGDALAAKTTGNDVPFSIIMSVEQATLSGGADPSFWMFANTSDSNTWHWFEQNQNAGIEVYRMRRASAAAFTTLPSTFPYPTTASLSSTGYWRHVLTALFTGTTTTVRVDGIVSSINAGAQDVASLTFSKFTVGAFRGATVSGYVAMKLRRLIFGASAFASNTYTAAENYMRQENQAVGSPKKGITAVCSPIFSFPSEPNPSFGGQQMLGLSWYYNYTVTPWGTTSSFTGPICDTLPPLTATGPTLPPYNEFVPAISSLAVADNAQNRTWAQTYGTHLLTFNEPYAGSLTVAQAIARWPTLVALGLNIGAPAVEPAAGGTWLNNFMTDPSAPHVDFIPIHSYVPATNFGNPGAATTAILNAINNTATTYGKPVWLTEFNGLDFSTTPWTAPTQAQMIAILQRLVPWLEASGNCARYSLFQMRYPLSDPVAGTFFNMCVADDGRFPADSVGATYADLGRL